MKNSTSKPRDFKKEYEEMFRIAGINPNQFVHEWEKEGDVFKKLDVYEKHPTPILTTDTFSINY